MLSHWPRILKLCTRVSALLTPRNLQVRKGSYIFAADETVEIARAYTHRSIQEFGLTQGSQVRVFSQLSLTRRQTRP